MRRESEPVPGEVSTLSGIEKDIRSGLSCRFRQPRLSLSIALQLGLVLGHRFPYCFLICLILASCVPSRQQVGGRAEVFSQPTLVSTATRPSILKSTLQINKAMSPTPSPTVEPTATSPVRASSTPHPLAQTEAAAIPTDPPCIQKGGKILTASYRTKLLDLPLDYRIYLPPCYEENEKDHYPVLYLMHGQGFTDDQWDRLGVNEKADRLAAAGRLPELIVVMPRDRYGGQPSESNFAKVVAGELVPLIDRKFRTKPGRDYRAVGGLSRGAGWSVHLALNYWKLFGALGAHSPAIFFEDAQRMRPLLDAIPHKSLPRIFMDVGDRDRPEIMQAAEWFEVLLNERDIPHEYHLFSGFHDETYWRDHLELYLLWYADRWQSR